MSKMKGTLYAAFIAAILIGCSCTTKTVTDSKEGHYYNGIVEIVEGENGMAVISGKNSSDGHFQIELNYAKADVILNHVYLKDFTNDNKKELCLEMNILNSISPDFNTILVYDMENDKVLFPTPDKSFIYDGYIDRVEIDYNVKEVIRYSSYTKINGIIIENENSVAGWNGDSFDTLEYYNKLLLETDEYIAFYKNSSIANAAVFQMTVLDPHTLQVIQEIGFMTDEADITKKIKDDKLVVQASSGPYDLYVEGYGSLQWDRVSKQFK